MTDDSHLLEEVLRVSGAMEVPVQVIATEHEAQQRWRGPDLILLGVDLAEALAAQLPRRSGLIVLSRPDAEDRSLRAAVSVGAADALVLPRDERRLAASIADLAEGPSLQGKVVGVRGVAGGLGASTVAAHMGLTAARSGHRVLLIDLDVTGPGIDLVLGIEAEPGMRWPDVAVARGRVSAESLVSVLPHVNGVTVLSWDRSPYSDIPEAALESVLRAGVRGFDIVVVDLGSIEARPSLRDTVAAFVSQTVVVCDGSVRGIVSAARLLASSPASRERVCLAVRGGPDAVDLVAETLQLPVAAAIPEEAAVRRAAEAGEVPVVRRRGGLSAACRQLLTHVLAA